MANLNDIGEKILNVAIPNPLGQDMLKGLSDGFKSILGIKLSKEQEKQMTDLLNKNVQENLDKHNGTYNPFYGAYKDTPLDTTELTTLVNSMNGVAKEIIAVPKYIYESAQTNPNVVASILVGVIGLLFMFKKGR